MACHGMRTQQREELIKGRKLEETFLSANNSMAIWVRMGPINPLGLVRNEVKLVSSQPTFSIQEIEQDHCVPYGRKAMDT